MVTLHELSVMFDITIRVLRKRVRRLVLEGKLKQDVEYRREGYVDDNHFLWRIDPEAFSRETGLRRVDRPDYRTGPPVAGPANPSGIRKPVESLINPANPPSGMEREMIDLLKDQLRVKDVQIGDLTIQNRSLTALNEKLNGVVVRHTEEIRQLLRLTGGRTGDPDIRGEPSGEPVVSRAVDRENGQGREVDT